MSRPLAVVSGGNRGLGLETCRQLAAQGYDVVLTARDADAARNAAGELRIDHDVLDVADPVSVAAFAARLSGRGRAVDALVNNAGVYLKSGARDAAPTTMAVNYHGPARLTDALRPHLAAGGRIVMVSSGLGELSHLGPERRRQVEDPALTRERLDAIVAEYLAQVEAGTHGRHGWPDSAYNVSKAALNALTRVLARDPALATLRINSVCPGWVRTAMGGPGAPRTLERGGRSIVWAATLPADGPTAGFFRDGKAIPW